jgi:hypothetical protein
MRTSDGTHQDGCADTDALTSSLESLDLNAGGCLNHDIEPWFAGKHSVEANDASTMAQETMTNERGAIQSERGRRYEVLDMYAGTPSCFNGINGLAYAPDVTHLYPMGSMNLPVYSSSMPEEEARGMWSPSEGLSQYTSPATLLSVSNPVGGGGGRPADLRSAISSFGLDDGSVNGQTCLDQAPFRSVGHDDFGALYSFHGEASFHTAEFDFVGGQLDVGLPGYPTAMADIRISPSTRRVRRRSSTKGDLEFKCTKPRCGWTFDTKADLR